MAETDPGISSRYLKQSILPEIGADGQARLARSRVLCVGAGGLGCAALPYLAGAGVGRITIVDHDTVERGNLQRQVLFGESDLGRYKAEAAAQRLADLNPEIEVRGRVERLEAGNVEALFAEHDLVIDGTDNYATKYLCADASVKYAVPLVYGTATGMEAMVTVFDAADGPCLRCLFPEAPTGWVPNCAEAGVLGPLVGMAGCIQAAEAVKFLCNQHHPAMHGLAGRLWLIDARDMSSRQLRIARRSDCPTCSRPRAEIRLEASDRPVEEITAAAARALETPAWIDVREPNEYAAGHIPGAVNLPLSALGNGGADPEKLPRAKTLIVYCATGPRSGRAAELLRAAGVENLRNLAGGIAQWGGPLERPVATRAQDP